MIAYHVSCLLAQDIMTSTETRWYGGTVYARNVNLVIRKSHIYGTTHSGGYGGAIFFAPSHRHALTIEETTFKSLKGAQGGAIMYSAWEPVYLDVCWGS